MGIFGAITAGVSGLDAQSSKISAISNNISNVNTVGYKQVQATFDTLVVPSGPTSFSPGGVIGSAQSLISQQGLLQATSSSTDAAITGNGFFVVNTKSDGTGNQLLTRSGSFTQDASGNFINANGYFLQGVSLAGVTTALTSINQNQLATVNINQNATGSANATTTMALAANFNASIKPILGSGETATLVGDATNSSNTASQIIFPTAANGLKQGDSFKIATGTNPAINFVYGGVTMGRDITATINTAAATTGLGNWSASNTTLLDNESVAAGSINNVNGQATIQVTVANGADYSIGGHISISGITSPIGGIPASQINGEQTVTMIAGNVITFAVTGPAGTGGTSTTAASVSNRTTATFTGNILNATSSTGDLLSGITNASTTFATGALSFQIIDAGAGGSTTSTFTYNAQPDVTKGQFNSLTTLAAAINQSSNNTMTASVVNGRLCVSGVNANDGLTFVNGNANGSSGLPGIDWTQELDLPPQSAAPVANINAAAPVGQNRFNTFNGLANEMNNPPAGNVLIATVNNPTSTGSTLSINNADPTSAITFTDGTANTGSSILKEFGFTGPGGAALTLVSGTQYTTTLPLTYSAASTATDMSSGIVKPQFTKDVTIYDALGNAHTLALNVAKLAVNTWAVELTSIPANAVVSSVINSAGIGDGQIAAGIVTFKTDGTFNAVTSQLPPSQPLGPQVTINWTQTGPNAVGAAPNVISLNLAQLIQSSGNFNVSTATQNGSPTGQLTGVSMDSSGFVTETFSNGQTKKAFQVPLANVNNPDGLQAISGDAFQPTLASGTVSYNIVGQGGTGAITPSSLEQSNVDLSTQLTNLIVAQQAYGANSKLLTVSDQLLQQLDSIIQ